MCEILFVNSNASGISPKQSDIKYTISFSEKQPISANKFKGYFPIFKEMYYVIRFAKTAENVTDICFSTAFVV